jgi:hypothetical protein
MKSFIINAINSIGVHANGKVQLSLKKTVMVAAGCAALLPLASNAQDTFGTVVGMHAEIPFRFTVGDRVFPAGKYLIHLNRIDHVVVLKSAKDYVRVSASSTTPFRNTHDAFKGRLEFNDYGSAVVLRKVWINGEEKGASVVRQTD